jgi:hypothetical protein
VQVHEPLQQLLHHNGNLGLGYQAWLHQVRTAPARAELHDDPQVRPVEVRAKVPGDVGRAHARQDHDLAHDVFHFVLGILDVDDLDRNRVARPAIEALVHLAKAAASYAFLLGEKRGRVDGLVAAQVCCHVVVASSSFGGPHTSGWSRTAKALFFFPSRDQYAGSIVLVARRVYRRVVGAAVGKRCCFVNNRLGSRGQRRPGNGPGKSTGALRRKTRSWSWSGRAGRSAGEEK